MVGGNLNGGSFVFGLLDEGLMATAAVTPGVATSLEMVTMLRRHYLPDPTRPGGIFTAEIPAPGSARRADVIWQGVTAAAGYELIGHEIKVSRADVLVELADPTKCDAWLQYCNRWWLVVAHPALIEGLDLPASWGVLAPPAGRRRRTCTVVHPAPQLQPAEQGPGLRAIATRLHWDGHNQRAEATRQHHELTRLRERIRELELLVPAAARNHHGQEREALIGRVIDALGGPLGPDGVGTWECRVSIDDVVTGLRDLGELSHRQEDVRRALTYGRRDASRLVTGLQRLLDETPGGGDHA